MVTTTGDELITKTILPAAIERVRRNAARFDGQFPSYGDGNTRYHLTANENWLASFWAGLLWLVYAQTDNADDKQRAMQVLPDFTARLTHNIRLNHDIGFLYTLSARAQYQLTGDDHAHQVALRAADVLYQRFRPVGEYIQAWGDLDDEDEAGRLIIDCMMNLPFLMWATQQTGDSRYRDAAIAHAKTSQQYLMRDDGSTYHTYFLNPADGSPVQPKTHQGYADDSLWSRGQAWAIYGFAALAQWLDDNTTFVESSQQAAACYMRNAPVNDVVPWDMRLPDEATPHPDSSADAIAAGGLLRLAELTDDDTYRQQAMQRIQMLYKKAFDHRPGAEGLLSHGTQHAPHNYGVDTYTIFGDYFFLETAMRLVNAAPDFWKPVEQDTHS
jgi:unsaturated chondroitin disaccharide hydrolase